MGRRLLRCAAAGGMAMAALLTPSVGAVGVAAPAVAAPPQCDDGYTVLPGCTGPGDCTAVINGVCQGQVAPLLPPPPSVRVGIGGGIGNAPFPGFS